MFDLLKTQIMTMSMVSSMNNHGSSQQKNNSFMSTIYFLFVTAFMEFIFTSVFPSFKNMVQKYYKDKIKTSKMIGEFITEKNNKTASITVNIKISDHENVLGQALLDYITNNEKTKHISLKKQNFILNQTDIIEISEEFFVKLNEQKTVAVDTVAETDTENIEQVIELFSYTKTMQELRSFLNKTAHEYKIKIENKLGDKIYYFNQHPMNAPAGIDGNKDYTKLPNNTVFTMKVFQTNRKFSNLFGPEINSVKKRVEFFMKNRKWYDSKGIPYTLGLLLSGQAGAGKTSTIKCLANETKRHIININLNNDITKTQMENLFFNELIVVLNVSTGVTEKYYIPLDRRIYVLEDIDCQSDLVMERSLKNNTEQPIDQPLVNVQTNPAKMDDKKAENWTLAEKIDLSFLLNLLDGVLENPGRIVIMTSNYPELLDHALIRPGRIDVSADFKKCSHSTIIEMMEFFYDIVLSDKEKDEIFASKQCVISPAEMGKIMFENFGNYNGAISRLCEVSTTKKETPAQPPVLQILDQEKQEAEDASNIDIEVPIEPVKEVSKKIGETNLFANSTIDPLKGVDRLVTDCNNGVGVYKMTQDWKKIRYEEKKIIKEMVNEERSIGSRPLDFGYHSKLKEGGLKAFNDATIAKFDEFEVSTIKEQTPAAAPPGEIKTLKDFQSYYSS